MIASSIVRCLLCGAAALLAVSSASHAQLRSDPAAMTPTGVRGFLAISQLPDAELVMPPPPERGGPRYGADLETFRRTRSLEGADRWAMAQRDDNYRPDNMLAAFSCSLGMPLSVATTPALAELLTRAAQDAGAAAVAMKERYRTPRPFLYEPGAVCVPVTQGLKDSYDYPSGHAALGWVQGLILAQLAPDRATAVLARARAFGDSRIVCGVHTVSAVEAGRLGAASVYAVLQTSPEYRETLERARQELDAVRASGARSDAAVCGPEAELIRPLGLLSR
jgi:acid phosphatase (class A)